MKAKLKFIIPILVIAAAVTAWLLLRADNNDRVDTIRVSGNIEVTDAQLGFKIPGLVTERPVDEGDTVRHGQLVARLDDKDLQQEVTLREADLQAAQAALSELLAGTREEEIAQAKAAVAQADAALNELLAGSRPQEIKAAAAAVDRAQANMEQQKLDFARQKTLLEKEVISEREFERARSLNQQAQAQLHEAEEHLKLVREGPRKETIEQARAALAQARDRYRMAVNGPRPQTIDQGRARVKQATEALDLARTRLGYATLTCPMDGVVLSKNIEPGEFVNAGTPVVSVANLGQVWLRAYIDETNLGQVKLGQAVEVTTDSYPDRTFKGRVSFIASDAEFTPKSVQTEKERVKLVYRIKVDLANPDMDLKPGMPADAVIRLGQ